jgi:hypothetical protein
VAGDAAGIARPGGTGQPGRSLHRLCAEALTQLFTC